MSELGLDFTAVTESLGVTSYIELKPDGKQTVVDNSNCIEYVHLMADYKLNRQVSAHAIYRISQVNGLHIVRCI